MSGALTLSGLEANSAIHKLFETQPPLLVEVWFTNVGTPPDRRLCEPEDLIRFILRWAQHRRPIRERTDRQTIAEQLQGDEARKREMKAMGMTIAQGIFLEGKTEGMKEGKTEGIKEGNKGVLLRLGRKKFGEPDAATLQLIQAIADPDQLDRLSDALLDVNSWADLLAVK